MRSLLPSSSRGLPFYRKDMGLHLKGLSSKTRLHVPWVLGQVIQHL